MAGLVEAARQGSDRAWAELVGRFQDLAVAAGLGWSGSLEDALDVAQEAFSLAHRNLGQLEDPAAFPGWFARVVRTASERQRRRREPVTVPLDAVPDLGGGQADPFALAMRSSEREQVRAAVEGLPEAERVVVALHYLAGLSYPEVSAFLGIGLSAAKKRGHQARRRLKEVLPTAADFLAQSRPSRERRFRDTILLFAAIRRRDRESVRRLLEADPDLVRAEEDWTLEEALEAHLPLARHATPLVRAAGAGDAEIVRLLLRAGADPSGACGCAVGETALWVAAVVGSIPVAAALLDGGADPNASTFRGATPLHVARQRGNQELADLLMASGADPDLRDAGGRRPEEWTRSRLRRLPEGHGDPRFLATGIRALDLFAPLTPGSRQRWNPAPGTGSLVVALELSRALAGAEIWWLGFEQDLADRVEVEHALAELGVRAEVRLVSRRLEAAAARARFEATLDEVIRTGGGERLVFCLEATGHAHDVALALPPLATARSLLATIVIGPPIGRPPASPGPPDGYGGQVTFDRSRAARALLPAIDPRSTTARRYPTSRHGRLAAISRTALAAYQRCDPDLELPDPESLPDPQPAAAAQRLIRYLTQPFVVAEPFTSSPGERTGHRRLLDEVEEMTRDFVEKGAE
ncbi:MAG: sigma-70 family RNA polymerase sigma factor [Candidatus Dormibacteraeota bacterium]|nr:sigma-70 family RNA polymerase sigma factor [Candidatus Dormibacteraeota bacterium]